MYDTIIIGAGMSGLAAGIRLAHFDKRVCILEKHTVIGGLNSFYRQGGRWFDVGLHAVTNFTPKGTRRGPLARLLRQLRFAWDELGLVPQIGSSIRFPGVELQFSNDFNLFESAVAVEFPNQVDNLRRLVASLADYEDLGSSESELSAREVMSHYIDDPLLIEMILCPLLYYGGAKEHDMDYGQFAIMFRAIYLEGLARPLDGVRLILRKLLHRFKLLGGELRLRTGVQRIETEGGRVVGVTLEDGSQLEAKHILSSAGWPETMQLCEQKPTVADEEAGRLSFIESISVLDKEPSSLGHDRTIVFFNDSETFNYRKPQDLVDLRSGVICSPNNFEYDQPLGEGMMRITALSNFGDWAETNTEEYETQKKYWYDRIVESAVRFVPDFRDNVIATDMFTPRTITRFTGRAAGAIYGTEKKRFDGRTPFDNLFICGTDQGFVGIIGTLVSGISIVNRYLLSPST